ncbi:MAG: hypothetical protein P8074_04430 [Anaerolineales bacterium]|jgi:DNA-binding NarL/FixJ family response regulator
MDVKRSIVLVEDSHYQFAPLKEELTRNNWEVFWAKDKQDAFFKIEQCQGSFGSLDAMALDLGFPPHEDDPFQAGIPLIQELRGKWKSLPILAYTALTPNDFSFSKAARILLRMRASFIYMRPPFGEKVTFSDILEMTWLGYVMINPAAVKKLPHAIAERPDPLDEKYWSTLKLLSEGKTQVQIAAELGDIGANGVKARIRIIKDILVAAGELKEFQDQQEDLVDWYQKHHVRYCRD